MPCTIKLTTEAAVGLARAAGFTDDKVPTAVAIAIAESALCADAVGDTLLVDAKWGPSVGLWQIRSLHAEKGTGGHRDELANKDPMHNAKAALSISGGGTNWAPWTVWKLGIYRPYVSQVQAVMQGSLAGGAPTTPGGIVGDYAGGIVDDPAAAGGAIVDGITDAASATVAIGRTVVDAAAWIADRDNWVRVLEVIGGAVAIALGLVLIGRDIAIPGGIAK